MFCAKLKPGLWFPGTAVDSRWVEAKTSDEVEI